VDVELCDIFSLCGHISRSAKPDHLSFARDYWSRILASVWMNRELPSIYCLVYFPRSLKGQHDGVTAW